MSTDINRAAKFSDAAKAWRVITTQISKKRRDGWVVQSYETQDKSVKNDSKRIRVDMDTPEVFVDQFDWDTVIVNIKQSFYDIINYKEKLQSKLNRIEEELCDCDHACEFFKFDAAKGYKLYSMIRERRLKRRFLKNELWKARSVLEMSYSDIANGKIDNAFSEIEQQSYEPRVLKELFSDATEHTTIKTV